MNIDQAKSIAFEGVRALAPYSTRIEIAGSISRRKPQVKDIEIVCIPNQAPALDLFNQGNPERCSHWIAAVRSLGTVAKGDPATGRYIKIDLASGISIDLFTATADNWGLILAIRTGPAEYSHHVLATGWVRQGFKSIDGMLHKDGRPIPVREERDLFNLAAVPYIEPHIRTV